MPCRDEISHKSYDDGQAFDMSHQGRELQKRVAKLEAHLCALLSEIKKLNNSEEIIKAANKNSKGIIRFFTEHTKEDEIRLAKELGKYSQHELVIIKQLLK